MVWFVLVCVVLCCFVLFWFGLICVVFGLVWFVEFCEANANNLFSSLFIICFFFFFLCCFFFFFFSFVFIFSYVDLIF